VAGIRKVDGAALRQLRTTAGLSLAQLTVLSRAHASSIHPANISRLETGVWRHCKEKTAVRLADGLSKALGRPVDPSEFSAPLDSVPAELAS
jgi:hypothetical protein